MLHRVTSTGFTEFVEAVPDKLPEFDPRKGEHFWTLIAIFKTNPEKMHDGPALLDHESLLSVEGPGCLHCGETYSPKLKFLRCKGTL